VALADMQSGLVIHQVKYEQLSFWRNPQSAVFTFVFPVVFVIIMGALFRADADARRRQLLRPRGRGGFSDLQRRGGADWRHLAVLAAWGAIGAIVAVRRFRWDPRPE